MIDSLIYPSKIPIPLILHRPKFIKTPKTFSQNKSNGSQHQYPFSPQMIYVNFMISTHVSHVSYHPYSITSHSLSCSFNLIIFVEFILRVSHNRASLTMYELYSSSLIIIKYAVVIKLQYYYKNHKPILIINSIYWHPFLQ